MRRTRRILTAVLIGSGSLWGGQRALATVAAGPPSTRPISRRLPRHTDRSHAAPAPDIILTGATRETRAVEARLAAFVRAVRRRDGARAARFLSRETAVPVRATVARRDWPWRLAPQDLAPLFSLPELRLRTLGLRRDRARVRIAARRVNLHSREASGYYDLGMVREGARWQVTLPRIVAPRAGTRRQR
jgi:hypothetical protein